MGTRRTPVGHPIGPLSVISGVVAVAFSALVAAALLSPIRAHHTPPDRDASPIEPQAAPIAAATDGTGTPGVSGAESSPDTPVSDETTLASSTSRLRTLVSETGLSPETAPVALTAEELRRRLISLAPSAPIIDQVDVLIAQARLEVRKSDAASAQNLLGEALKIVTDSAPAKDRAVFACKSADIALGRGEYVDARVSYKKCSTLAGQADDKHLTFVAQSGLILTSPTLPSEDEFQHLVVLAYRTGRPENMDRALDVERVKRESVSAWEQSTTSMSYGEWQNQTPARLNVTPPASTTTGAVPTATRSLSLEQHCRHARSCWRDRYDRLYCKLPAREVTRC